MTAIEEIFYQYSLVADDESENELPYKLSKIHWGTQHLKLVAALFSCLDLRLFQEGRKEVTVR